MHTQIVAFDTEKYKALAFGRNDGIKLADLVEGEWSGWTNIVARAPWLRLWRKSVYWDRQGTTPMGRECAAPWCPMDVTAIALAIYVTAVWGFGLDCWERNYIKIQRALSEVQHVATGNIQRRYFLCNGGLPQEFVTLDEWLSVLWKRI